MLILINNNPTGKARNKESIIFLGLSSSCMFCEMHPPSTVTVLLSTSFHSNVIYQWNFPVPILPEAFTIPTEV